MSAIWRRLKRWALIIRFAHELRSASFKGSATWVPKKRSYIMWCSPPQIKVYFLQLNPHTSRFTLFSPLNLLLTFFEKWRGSLRPLGKKHSLTRSKKKHAKRIFENKLTVAHFEYCISSKPVKEATRWSENVENACHTRRYNNDEAQRNQHIKQIRHQWGDTVDQNCNIKNK